MSQCTYDYNGAVAVLERFTTYARINTHHLIAEVREQGRESRLFQRLFSCVDDREKRARMDDRAFEIITTITD